MVRIAPTTFIELAASRKQNYTRVSVKEETIANVLYNDTSFDVFYAPDKNGKISGRMTKAIPNADTLKRAVHDFLIKFKDSKVKIDGLDEIIEWSSKL